MNIEIIGDIKTVMSGNGDSHGYFAWPTVERLRNGKIAAACSGFRIEHICPFGKAVMVLSDDDGNSFSAPVAVIDTVLDDRDAGLCAFGDSRLILTSFNNTVEFQRKCGYRSDETRRYLDSVSAEDEKKALGSEFRISFDNGETFGEIFHSPVTSPHGPVELRDGRILWVGALFTAGSNLNPDVNMLQAWEMSLDGNMKKIGEIENIYIDGILIDSCEPYVAELPDGTLICQIRVSYYNPDILSLYQTESVDGGRTWSKPHALLGNNGGAPAHLLNHSSGTLISTYGYREMPYGIRAMLSTDGGKTWEKDKILYEQDISDDIGYPATVELTDGSLLTVFYAHKSAEEPASILSVRWKITG